jgi:hypothetical protein
VWPNCYDDRLAQWYRLRQFEKSNSLDHVLHTIEQWWTQTPWQPYFLHWDDADFWPSPWELLADNVYCNLARALGIVYTVSMLENHTVSDLILAEIDSHNLVLVNQGKYILNWDSTRSLNTCPDIANITRQISAEQILKKIK